MAGGFSTPKKDQMIKVSNGQLVKTGHILSRGISAYKAGVNVKGKATLFALCNGTVLFRKKKTLHGKVMTFINIVPVKSEASSKK
jgi:ribosomal protein L27